MEKNWIRVIFKQRLLIIALLCIQLLFILLLIANTHRVFRYMDFVLQGFSVFVCFHILNKMGKSAFKMTWIFLILLFPIFGGIVYVFFHTQSSSKKLKKQMIRADENFSSFFVPAGDALPDFAGEYPDRLPQVRYLQDHAKFPLCIHTQTLYFNSGEKFFERLLLELEKAESYIFLEFFILGRGKMLNPVLETLEKKARAGVDVRIIYDDLGCFTLPTDFPGYLEERGIKSMIFNPFRPILTSLQNNRDHRKIISIDGKIAFTGGINLADEYINARERFGHWKDSGVMLRGEAAWNLTLIFLKMWSLRKREPRAPRDDPGSLYPWKNPDGTPSVCTVESDGYVQPYADNPMNDENVGEHVYIQMINNAKDYVYISTPYLVIDDNLLSALTLAAKSGVDVRIITPHRWDKWIVAICSRSYYRQLILAGVKVYEYTHGFHHSKTFVSDDLAATVGTTNLDFRSLYLHFECGVWMYKTASVAEIKKDFLDTLPSCRKITLRDCARNALQRVFQDVLRLFAPLM